jgi:hypothetical protein
MSKTQTKCKCKKEEEEDMMFYFRVIHNPEQKYDTLDARNKIEKVLNTYNYDFMDMTGGQGAFHPLGSFEVFKFIVELVAKQRNYTISEIKHCPYPGLGLFW